MSDSVLLSRRTFLHGSALVAGAAALSACSGEAESGPSNGGSASTDVAGSRTESLPAPETYRQAPALDGQDLPPVAERLPDHPYVIPHRWAQPGKYGGKLQMNVFSVSGAAGATSDLEFFYGHSPLRYLNDGQDIGPGLVESWEANDDASEWTFHFRTGMKWSDGQPWTTQDVLFWWEDFVLEQSMAQVPPDETRSGTGTLAKFSAIDDTTLTLTFDAPAPLTADRMAMWVNGSIGSNGPIWTMPKHYLKQFHPAYNDNVPDDWDTVGGLMQRKADWHRNPDCPTMIGYTCKSFDTNRGVVLERNPYYWCVMPGGDQLPYIDEIRFTVVSDAEAGKLQIQQGNADYVHGPFNGLSLTDVQGLRENADESGLEVLLWDSGSGGSPSLMLNYDYIDDDLRSLIRDPKFRQAISHAHDRESIHKSVFFNTGEITTGTVSPKAIEYHVNATGERAYQQWRDAYVAYDPAKAKRLLDEVGVADADGDGLRELPNGKKLTLRLDYGERSVEQEVRDNQLVADLKAIGLELKLNPIPPQAFGDQWETGKLMARGDWDLGDGPSHLVHPLYFVPIDSQRWAPLQGQWYSRIGTGLNDTELDVDPWQRHPPRMRPEKGGVTDRLQTMYDQSKVEPDGMRRHEMVWEMIKIHIADGPLFMGAVANYKRVVAVKRDLRNVPRSENLALGGYANPWIHPTPAVYDPECFYWENPDQHT